MDTKCWKCGRTIHVVIDTSGWSFNSFSSSSGFHTSSLWPNMYDEEVEAILKGKNVKREFRYSRTAGDSYMANKLLLIKNGKLKKEYLD